MPAARVGSKPVDVGNGNIVASFLASRPALLSVTVFQPEHGVAELAACPAFDEGSRGDPNDVRRYRAMLASDDFPCLELETANGTPAAGGDAETADPERPRWQGAVTAEARAEGDAIVLEWRDVGRSSPGSRLHFRGRLDRPALAEITELDPPRPTGALTTLHADGSRLVVRSTLPAVISIDISAGDWIVDGNEAAADVGGTGGVSVRLSVLDVPRGRRRARRMDADDPIVRRALAYTRTCAALQTASDEVAILADHRLLPLSWTRDAYYQALLLLATGDLDDSDLVADHLRWLWRRCERVDGRWLRSHHANGRPKDRAFQSDQQLYPMVELADFWRARRELPGGVDWAAEVPIAWSAAVREIDEAAHLIATAENAADDPVAAPFVAGSQILVWYAALRLAEVATHEPLGLEPSALRNVAVATWEAFDRHLTTGGAWLYATDARSIQARYHDANDLPVALAPLLGFCPPDDPGWHETMEFAFSEANSGYFAGERGGLGSAHTPGPWTLGDIQAWVRARVRGDVPGMAAAMERLREVAFHDGMLPEAYSETRQPDKRIRHWFAWPGAALGALLLLETGGNLERLSVSH